MSEPRHATVRFVAGIMGRMNEVFAMGVLACGEERGRVLVDADVADFITGVVPADRRITCDRCAIIVDAALEGVRPFPFSLPGVPDEALI